LFELYIILGFMILGSIIALELKNLLAAVITIGAVGFALTLGFIYLAAPDIAIAQIAVEIVTLVILLNTIYVLKHDDTMLHKRVHIVNYIFAFLILVLSVVFSYEAFQGSSFGNPAFLRNAASAGSYYIENGVRDTGAVNTVTSIILDYRAYDTLGEATVLFVSILGAITLLREKSKK